MIPRTLHHLPHRATTLAVALLLTLTMLLAAPALAAPSIDGPTGLIFAPTADVLGTNQFNFAAHILEPLSIVTFNMSPLTNLEFGITSYMWRGGSEVAGNVKYKFVDESKSAPALAVGIKDVAHDYRQLYFVGSKNIPQLGLRGHLGLATGSTGLFMGISKQLNTVSIGKPGRSAAPTVFLAEIYDSNINVGASIGLTPELSVDVYLVDLDQAAIGFAYKTKF